MLYVFQVDTGTMLMFDMNLALDSVSTLKEAICKLHKIPPERQVLLKSGGDCLVDADSRVGSYLAGTDTNPIFLFNIGNIESCSPTSSAQNQQQSSNPDSLTGENIKEKIDGCIALPSNYVTVVARAQLAQQLHELAVDLKKRCEQLIAYQHLQHQGWAAVVANLEDIVKAFKQKNEAFTLNFESFLQVKESKLCLLETFQESLDGLKTVPILKSITADVCVDESEAPESLLDYLSLQQPSSSESIDNLSESCQTHLDQLNMGAIEALKAEATSVIEKSNQSSMKEIKGLEERLFGLDQLLIEAKKIVQEQQELAQAFMQNQNRAKDLQDTSVIPDLCQSHQHQLSVMGKNHQQLEDIKRRCAKAKEELTYNLISRLKWVVLVQRSINECGSRIEIFLKTLKKIDGLFHKINQLQSCRELYGKVIQEVVRRKQFAEAYLKWSFDAYNKMDSILIDELDRRRCLDTLVQFHFLSRLFSGLNDKPCRFIQSKPAPFDFNLPEILPEEIEKFKKLYPSINFDIDCGEKRLCNEEDNREKIDSKSILVQEIKRLTIKNEEQISEFENVKAVLDGTIKTKEEENSKLKDQLKVVASSEESKNAEIRRLMEDIEKNKQETIQKEKDLLKTHEEQLEEMKNKFQDEMDKLKKDIQSRHEEELRHISEKHRHDLDALTARFKFQRATFEQNQKSPSESEQRSLEFERSIDAFQSPPMARRERHYSDVELLKSEESDSSAMDAMGISVVAPDSDGSSGTDSSSFLNPSNNIVLVATQLCKDNKIVLQSCRKGDKVLFYWNTKLENYVVYSGKKRAYFLHTDCLSVIGEDRGPSVGFIGQIVDREYCVAKKIGNRYHVPVGFHFDRIKVHLLEKINFDLYLTTS